MKKLGLLLAILVLVSVSAAIAAEPKIARANDMAVQAEPSSLAAPSAGDASVLLDAVDAGDATNSVNGGVDWIFVFNCAVREFFGEFDEDGCYTPKGCRCYDLTYGD